jgi:hypothetical protein
MNGLGWWALGALVVLLVAVWPRHGAIARARHRATTRAH